jgi:hypothetical protein
MALLYNDEHRKQLHARIVAIAQQVLSGKLGVVAGARELVSMRFDVGAEHDPDFIFFAGVDSETDHLPLGDARSRWDLEALKAKDAELATYETKVRHKALQTCRNLIRKYDSDTPLREYDIVRVVRLLSPTRYFSGTEAVSRPPQIGDQAVICHEYEPNNPAAAVAVEMIDRNGYTIWLADFAREELELISRPRN